MQIKPWWIYKLRSHGCAIIDKGWDGEYWLGRVWRIWDEWPNFRRWHLHRNSHSPLDPVGKPLSDDLTTPIISARDLVFRKLNPPTALTVAVETKRAEEVLFDQSW